MTRNRKRTPQQVVVGQNLRAARKAVPLTQLETEGKSGVAYRHYQDIETGKVNVSLNTLIALAKAFGTTVNAITRGI